MRRENNDIEQKYIKYCIYFSKQQLIYIIGINSSVTFLQNHINYFAPNSCIIIDQNSFQNKEKTNKIQFIIPDEKTITTPSSQILLLLFPDQPATQTPADPRCRKYIVHNFGIFDRSTPSNRQQQFLTKTIIQHRNALMDSIEREVTVYKQTDYKFVFPSTKFPQIKSGQRNTISYERRVEAMEEDTFQPKLTRQQLAQISVTGTFEVRSNNQNTKIPYVWKINDWLMRGKVNIVHVWQCGIAAIYSRMVSLIELVITTIPNSLRKLMTIPIRLFSLIFGYKSMKCVYAPDHSRQVWKDFWSEVMSNQYQDVTKQIGSSFLGMLYLQYQEAIYREVQRKDRSEKEVEKEEAERMAKVRKHNKKKNKINELKKYLMQLDDGFESMWVKIRKRILTRIANEMMGREKEKEEVEVDERAELIGKKGQEKNNEKIIERLHEQKLEMYKNYIKQNIERQKKMNGQKIQQLLILVMIITIISQKITKKNLSLTTKQQQISSQIKKQYTIRSKDHQFFHQHVQILYQAQKTKIQSQFYNQLLQEQKLQQYLTPQFKTLYQKYLHLKTTYSTLLTQKQLTSATLYIPSRIFKSTYHLLPPYEKLKTQGYYYLKKQEEVTIDTGTNYWKFKLYGMRLKTWTINCGVFLMYFAWKGVLGLRRLYGVKKFVVDESINYKTGEKINIEGAPFLKVFKTVLEGITKSRNYFQSLPDRGLFGKKFSRIFNYIECYIFRFAFVGVLLTLILYPIAIIISSILCIILIISIWIWVPLILLSTYIFNIMVFQFESNIVDYSVTIKGIPLLALVISVVVEMVKCVGVVVWLGLGSVFSLGHLLVVIGQRYLRKVTDWIMLRVIGYMGRTPSRDTAIARKISGPGISRSYFFSVLEQDVYVLTQCALQKLVMKKFIDLSNTQISSNSLRYQKMLQYTLKPFPNTTFMRNYCNFVCQNTLNLLTTFNKAAQKYMNRYPNYPRSVRFTQEEIAKYFTDSVKIVKNFVQKEKIQAWVFDQCSVAEDDYTQLTRKIWIDIFNCGEEIFQPIESIDCRVKLVESANTNEDTIMRDNVKSIVNALQGQIKLTTSQYQFCPGEKSLLDRDWPIRSLYALCLFHSLHEDICISLDLENPSELLVAPRNLQELKRYDEWRYEQVIKQYGGKCQKGMGDGY